MDMEGILWDWLGAPILSVLGAMGAVMMLLFVAVVVGWTVLAYSTNEHNAQPSMKYMARLTFIFQILHMAEHSLQVLVLVMSGMTVAYMSPVAEFFQAGFALLSGHYMDMGVGMEILHLTGNFIFFMGIVCWLGAGYTSKLMKAALWLQGFHVLEHICLTVTKLQLGEPYGISTMFQLLPPSIAIPYRVLWHFTMNLIATIMVWRAIRNQRVYLPRTTPGVLQPVLR